MMNALRIAAQFLLYLPMMAIIGVFSTSPRFASIAPDQALVRLSIVHAAERKEACRTRSQAELAKLAPNMRAALDCPRERSALRIELEIDGEVVVRRDVKPAGLRRDGAGSLYARVPLAAGPHRIVARLRDRSEGGFNYVHEGEFTLAPGGLLLIDFDSRQGGFLFRS